MVVVAVSVVVILISGCCFLCDLLWSCSSVCLFVLHVLADMGLEGSHGHFDIDIGIISAHVWFISFMHHVLVYLRLV